MVSCPSPGMPEPLPVLGGSLGPRTGTPPRGAIVKVWTVTMLGTEKRGVLSVAAWEAEHSKADEVLNVNKNARVRLQHMVVSSKSGRSPKEAHDEWSFAGAAHDVVTNGVA